MVTVRAIGIRIKEERSLPKATPKMIGYAETLIEKCEYDLSDYDFDKMSFQEVSDLIDELKEELGLDEERGSYHARRKQ